MRATKYKEMKNYQESEPWQENYKESPVTSGVPNGIKQSEQGRSSKFRHPAFHAHRLIHSNSDLDCVRNCRGWAAAVYLT
jgi:hypothetical protein